MNVYCHCFEREAHSPMTVGRVLQDRERRPHLRQRYALDAFGRRGVDCYAHRAVAAVHEQLREHAARRVAHQDGRSIEAPDHPFQTLHDLRDGDLLDRGRVGVQRLDLDLEAWVRRRQHGETLRLVVGDPLLPASRGDPEAVDQDDGVGRVTHDRDPRVRKPTVSAVRFRRSPDVASPFGRRSNALPGRIGCWMTPVSRSATRLETR